MKIGTIRKTRVCGMRYGGCLSRTRDSRERTLPDGSQSCGSARDAGATREYQRDSSSKRPIFSVASNVDAATSPINPRPPRRVAASEKLMP